MLVVSNKAVETIIITVPFIFKKLCRDIEDIKNDPYALQIQHSSNQNPIKIFCTNCQIHFKTQIKAQSNYSSQNNFEKEKQVGDKTSPDFKTYKVTAIKKIVWYCHKYRHIDQ